MSDAVVALCEPSDEPGMRALMRRLPMQGAITIAFEREPDFFIGAGIEGHGCDVVVARVGDEVVGMGARTRTTVWFNGQPARVGYDNAMRVLPEWRGGQVTQPGYEIFGQLRAADELPFDITALVTDNLLARQALRSDRKGFPRFLPRQPLCTLVVPTWRRLTGPAGLSPRPATEDDVEAIADCLSRNLSRYQFAPVWTAADLRDPVRTRGLSASDFTVLTSGDRVVACCAVWDQSAFKQSVIQGYRGVLRWGRPVVNLLAPVLNIPRLPPPGQQMRHAFLSHIAADDDDEAALLCVLTAAYSAYTGEGYLTLGLPVAHPAFSRISRHFGAREYHSVLHTVDWRDSDEVLRSDDGRCAHLEVAIL
jgi:hypothetical protein